MGLFMQVSAIRVTATAMPQRTWQAPHLRDSQPPDKLLATRTFHLPSSAPGQPLPAAPQGMRQAPAPPE